MIRMLAGTSKSTFLPAGVRDQLLRGARAGGGFGLILFAAYLAVALISHHGDDPSLNTATAASPQNLMGAGGSILSDLLLQSLGYASLLIMPVLIAWGIRLIRTQKIRLVWVKLALLPVTVSMAALVLTLAFPFNAEVFSAGPGGVTGQLLFESTIFPWSQSGRSPGAILWLPAGAGTVLLFLYLLGFSWAEWSFALGLVRCRVLNASRWVGATVYRRFSERFNQSEDSGIGSAPSKRAANRPIVDTRPQNTPKDAQNKPVQNLVEKKKTAFKPGKKALAARQPRLDLDIDTGDFRLPALNLLQDLSADFPASQAINEEGLEQNARLLESVLQDFGVRGEIVKVRPGPVVTLYELEPAPGTKTSRVIGLADDIARSMSAISVRIATVPGRNVIGIEMPNSARETVLLRELLSAQDYESAKGKLPIVLGKDIGGTPVISDLAKMPHLLIAGTTGSGKSVGLNAIILSLLYRLPPTQCRFIMIDPKMLELSVYHDIPHLLTPVVTDPKKAVVALKWAVREMEDRYQAMSKLGVRNIEGYNKRVEEAAKKGECLTRKIQTGFDRETGKAEFEEQELDLNPLPFIVVVADEIADLMLVAGKDIEASIQRLAQMARAAGIHLIMATQRPSVDVITGTIKANFPTRISFQVTSKIDSRTILGEQGAEQLLGQGDMLFTGTGGQLIRVHGPFVSDEEVEVVTDHLREQAEPHYDETITEEEDGDFGDFGSGGNDADALYDRAVALVCQEQKASTSFIQRHLQIGYNRAARIMEQMEKQGVVSAANHVGKREILAGSH
jgi:S-DNA-T family DNA segregation ATPase FtsK/SpoIIIE